MVGMTSPAPPAARYHAMPGLSGDSRSMNGIPASLPSSPGR
jgi:hypothetical protein